MPPPDLPALSEPYLGIVFNNELSTDSNVPSFDRLAFVGENVLRFGIMRWLHTRYAKAPTNTLKRRLEKKVIHKPTAWGRLYKLRSHCAISSLTNVSNDPVPSPPVRRFHSDLFCAYVGAVFLERGGEEYGGIQVTNKWISEIFEYEIDEGSADSGDEHELFSSSNKTQSPGPKYISPSSSPTNSRGFYNLNTTRSGATYGVNGNGSNVNSSSNPVSQLNELATKKNKKIFWEDFSVGPSHLSEWTSTIKISDSPQEYTGRGLSKKMARAAAAELALRDISWQ